MKSVECFLKTVMCVLVGAICSIQAANAQIKDGEATVYEGKTVTVSLGAPYQRTLRQATNISYSWRSGNSSCVAIKSSTKDYAVIEGKRAVSSCRLYYDCQYFIDGFPRSMNFYYEITVEASTVKVTRILLNQSAADMEVGGKLQLSATVYPIGATNRNVGWYSSNSAVASVNSYGLVTALSAGSTTITCSAADGSGQYATCKVVVCSSVQEIVISDESGLTDIPSVAHVRYERTFEEGWNSVCLPFAIDAGLLGLQDARIALLDDMKTVGDAIYLSYRVVDRVEAGVPCLVYVPVAQKVQIYLEDVSLVSKPDDSGLLKGVFVETVIGKECYKLASDGQSFATTKTPFAICSPFRAYVRK